MKAGTICWMAVALVWGSSAAAAGEIRTFAMEGTITYVNDPLHMLDWINVGSDRMVYTFSFDSEAPDMNPHPYGAEYNGLSAILRVGEHTILASAPMIGIAHPFDAFRLESELHFNSDFFGSAFLTLSDQAENNALVDVSLPSTPYPLDVWEFRHFDFGMDVPQSEYPFVVTLTLGGDIDSFYIVPEGASVLLLLLGFLFVRRRRS